GGVSAWVSVMACAWRWCLSIVAEPVRLAMRSRSGAAVPRSRRFATPLRPGARDHRAHQGAVAVARDRHGAQRDRLLAQLGGDVVVGAAGAVLERVSRDAQARG